MRCKDRRNVEVELRYDYVLCDGAYVSRMKSRCGGSVYSEGECVE